MTVQGGVNPKDPPLQSDSHGNDHATAGDGITWNCHIRVSRRRATTRIEVCSSCNIFRLHKSTITKKSSPICCFQLVSMHRSIRASVDKVSSLDGQAISDYAILSWPRPSPRSIFRGPTVQGPEGPSDRQTFKRPSFSHRYYCLDMLEHSL